MSIQIDPCGTWIFTAKVATIAIAQRARTIELWPQIL